MRTMRARHSNKLQCNYYGWAKLGDRVLGLYTPKANYCDMTGAIEEAKTIMPEVMRIETYVDDIPDTVYALFFDKWMAFES